MNAALQIAAPWDDAAALLGLLARNEEVTFQTFGEGSAKGERGLNRILHGTLAQHRQTLADLNARGAGVFWMVSAGDGKGRKASNVRRIRALFVDLDGAPLDPIKTARLAPHCIVESSPDRWHAYWLVSGCPLDCFTPLQKALAARFNADPKVCDLPRVMRMPGFVHRKSKPFQARVLSLCDAPPYPLAEFQAAFATDVGSEQAVPRITSQLLPTTQQRRPRTLERIPDGERNTTLWSLATGLVRRGFDLPQANKRMQCINTRYCDPPLSAEEVEDIVSRAVTYGSEGFATLPHKLLDSLEWKALPPAAHDIVLMAYRRYDGTNAGIALTYADFAGALGFAKKDTFYKHRSAVLQAGILRRVCSGSNTQTGRKPDLFAIASKWLRVPPVPRK